MKFKYFYANKVTNIPNLIFVQLKYFLIHINFSIKIKLIQFAKQP